MSKVQIRHKPEVGVRRGTMGIFDRFRRKKAVDDNPGSKNLGQNNLGQNNLGQENLNKGNLNKDSLNKDNLNKKAQPPKNPGQEKPGQETADKKRAIGEEADRRKTDKEGLNREKAAAQKPGQETDKEKLDRERLSKEGLNREGSNKEGLNKEGSNKEGLNKEKLNKEGLHTNKANTDKSAQTDKENPNKENPNRENTNKENINKENINKENADKKNADKNSSNKGSSSKEKADKQTAQADASDKNNSDKRIFDKMAYLQKYHKDVQVISEGIDNIREIPDRWRELLQMKKKQDKADAAVQMWRDCMGDCLSRTIAYMAGHLTDVELITYKGNYSLLYSITSTGGKTLYYEGGNPDEYIILDELKRKWNAIPETIHSFYDSLHDGFYYYASSSRGMYRLDNVLYLNDYDWSFIEELSLDIEIDLETAFGFFGAGMGAYVVIDISDCEEDSATMWFSDKEPEYHVNFWKMVDEWLVKSFDADN